MVSQWSEFQLEETKLEETKLATPPRLRQATADLHALSALSPQHLTDTKAEEETKLVEIKLEETKLEATKLEATKLEATKLEETMLATPPQLLPYVTPKKVSYEVGCKVGTSEPKPWPDPLPPSRPPRHLGTSEPRHFSSVASAPRQEGRLLGWLRGRQLGAQALV